MLSLITGAQGALGRSLVSKLISEGHSVHILTRGSWRGLDSGSAEIAGDRLTVSRCNLKSRREIEEHISGLEPAFVYHLSSNNDNSRSRTNSICILEDNAAVTFNVLAAAASIRSRPVVIFPSSAEAERIKDVCFEYSPYSVSKHVSELMGRCLRNSGQLKFFSIRLPTVFGIGDTRVNRLIPSLLTAISSGRPFSPENPTARLKLVSSEKAANLLFQVGSSICSETDAQMSIDVLPTLTVNELVSLIGLVYSRNYAGSCPSIRSGKALNDDDLWQTTRGLEILEHYEDDFRRLMKWHFESVLIGPN